MTSAPGGSDIDMAAFRAKVEAAGLGPVPEEDLERMANYWKTARGQIASLRTALSLTDEPANTFSADPPRLR